MMTDPIADMLTRIRNAQMAGLKKIEIPYSNLKFGIAKLLEQEGYLQDVEKKETKPFNVLAVKLRYNGKNPVIQSIKRESKPGHRQYRKANEIPKILNNLGSVIISTPKGLMTGKQAKKEGLGGEIICSVF